MRDIEEEKSILEAGREGEQETVKALQLIGPRIKYLSNARFIYDDVDAEHDLIVIAKTGIFTIEVKNYSHDAYLNSNGILFYRNRQTDLIQQIRRHQNCLWRILHENSNLMNKITGDCDIHSIILWQNKDSDIEDDFGKVPICCINDLEYEIPDTSKYKGNLSDSDIEKIYHYLHINREKDRRYPLNVPEDFVDLVINGACSQYEINLNKSKQELCKLQEKLQDLLKQIEEKEKHPVWYYSKRIGKGLGTVAYLGILTIEFLSGKRLD